jgi:hypothetical protein
MVVAWRFLLRFLDSLRTLVQSAAMRRTIGSPTTGTQSRPRAESGVMGYLDSIFGRLGFARFAAKLMRTIRGTDELRFDAAERRILQIRDGKVVGAINLTNLYGNYRRTPRARRPDYLQVCVRTVLAQHRELPDEFAAASPDLRPRLWARATTEHHRLLKRLGDSGGGELDTPSEPVGEHLLARLAYDWPESVQSVGTENLAGWGDVLPGHGGPAAEPGRGGLRQHRHPRSLPVADRACSRPLGLGRRAPQRITTGLVNKSTRRPNKAWGRQQPTTTTR